MAALHWFMGYSILGMTVSGWVAGQIPNDKEKTDPKTLEYRGKMMHLHESFGLLMLLAIVPRVGLRYAYRNALPAHLPAPAWQRVASSISHGALYAGMVFMPVSGLAFGYFSCWGVPFFYWDVPGLPKEKYTPRMKAIEDFFYVNHHRVGQWMEFLVPVHIGAVVFNKLIRGQDIIRRMIPWGSKAIQAPKVPPPA